MDPETILTLQDVDRLLWLRLLSDHETPVPVRLTCHALNSFLYGYKPDMYPQVIRAIDTLSDDTCHLSVKLQVEGKDRVLKGIMRHEGNVHVNPFCDRHITISIEECEPV